MSKRYWTKDHECSRCGLWCDEGAFKLHTDVECFMNQCDKMATEAYIRDFDKKRRIDGLSSMWIGN